MTNCGPQKETFYLPSALSRLCPIATLAGKRTVSSVLTETPSISCSPNKGLCQQQVAHSLSRFPSEGHLNSFRRAYDVVMMLKHRFICQCATCLSSLLRSSQASVGPQLHTSRTSGAVVLSHPTVATVPHIAVTPQS